MSLPEERRFKKRTLRKLRPIIETYGLAVASTHASFVVLAGEDFAIEICVHLLDIQFSYYDLRPEPYRERWPLDHVIRPGPPEPDAKAEKYSRGFDGYWAKWVDWIVSALEHDGHEILMGDRDWQRQCNLLTRDKTPQYMVDLAHAARERERKEVGIWRIWGRIWRRCLGFRLS